MLLAQDSSVVTPAELDAVGLRVRMENGRLRLAAVDSLPPGPPSC